MFYRKTFFLVLLHLILLSWSTPSFAVQIPRCVSTDPSTFDSNIGTTGYLKVQSGNFVHYLTSTYRDGSPVFTEYPLADSHMRSGDPSVWPPKTAVECLLGLRMEKMVTDQIEGLALCLLPDHQILIQFGDQTSVYPNIRQGLRKSLGFPINPMEAFFTKDTALVVSSECIILD